MEEKMEEERVPDKFRVEIRTRKNGVKKVLFERAETPKELPPGWIKENQITKKNHGIRRDPFYIDPKTKYRFRSLKSALCYIKTGKIGDALKPGNNKQKEIKVVFEKAETPKELPPGWIKENKITKKRWCPKIRRDPFYIDPKTKYRFCSLKDALRYIKTGKIGPHAKRPRDSQQNDNHLKDEQIHPLDEFAEQKLEESGISVNPDLQSSGVPADEQSKGSHSSGSVLDKDHMASEKPPVQSFTDAKSPEQTDIVKDFKEGVPISCPEVGPANQSGGKRKGTKAKRLREVDLPRRTSKRLAEIAAKETRALVQRDQACPTILEESSMSTALELTQSQVKKKDGCESEEKKKPDLHGGISSELEPGNRASLAVFESSFSLASRKTQSQAANGRRKSEKKKRPGWKTTPCKAKKNGRKSEKKKEPDLPLGTSEQLAEPIPELEPWKGVRRLVEFDVPVACDRSKTNQMAMESYKTDKIYAAAQNWHVRDVEKHGGKVSLPHGCAPVAEGSKTPAKKEQKRRTMSSPVSEPATKGAKKRHRAFISEKHAWKVQKTSEENVEKSQVCFMPPPVTDLPVRGTNTLQLGSNNKAGSRSSIPEDLWKDPCIAFAIKTLIGESFNPLIPGAKTAATNNSHKEMHQAFPLTDNKPGPSNLVLDNMWKGPA